MPTGIVGTPWRSC